MLRRAHRIIFRFPCLRRCIGHEASLRPSQRGKNLSTRYKRLETSLRGKEELAREIEHFVEYPIVARTDTTTPKEKVETFHGFEIPKEPIPPQDDECCMSNCAVCVYDLYEESLDTYKDAISNIRTALTGRNIPEEEWPKSLRSPTITKSVDRKATVLNAFEEMERALAKKQQATQTDRQ